MKTHSIFLILLFTVLSCSNPKSNQEVLSADSMNQVTDNILTQNEGPVNSQTTSENDGPFSGTTTNFPEFIMDEPVGDSLETEINNGFSEILQAYDTIKYFRISSSYAYSQPTTVQGQDGPDTYVVNVSKEETRLWLFDRSFTLRCFTSEVKYNNGDGTAKESTTYLFSHDSLIAVSERVDDSYEVEVIDHAKILSSQCPRCGVRRYGEPGNPTISYLTKVDLASKEKKFYESMPELINILKAGRKNAGEDDFYFLFEIKQTKEADPDNQAKAVTYPVSFMVEKDLYPNYISKQK